MIVLDLDSVIKNNSPLHQTIKNTKNIALIVVIPNSILKQLENIPKGEKRVDFINSSLFVSNIKAYCICEYLQNKNLCIIYCNTNDNLSDYISTLEKTFLPDTRLIARIERGIERSELITSTLIENGFHNPYKIKDTLILSRKCKNNFNNPSLVRNKIKHMNENKESCETTYKLSKKAIKYLKEACKNGHTKNKDGSISQKEMTGELYLKDAIDKNNKIIHIIDIDERSINSGEEENINVHPTRYNFHSHPEEAYVRHSVTKAWPSILDYLGYLKLGKNTIFHCIASLEGVYIMSFTKEWASNLKDVNQNFVKKNFDINHRKHYSPKEYVNHVNSIKYKEYPIFKLWFFKWNEAETPFKVNFSKIEDACLVNQESVEIHKHLSPHLNLRKNF